MLKMDMLNLGIYWVNSYIIRDESSKTSIPADIPKRFWTTYRKMV